MTLRVLSVAYPFAPVTADPVGGAEQVLGHLDRALVAAGHRSTVIASAGSAPAGALLAVPHLGQDIDPAGRVHVHDLVRRRMAEAMERERPDVVHLHGLDFEAYLPPPGVPLLVTLHLPLDWYAPAALRPTRPDTWLLPVSQDQARRGPPGLRLLPPIDNGVDLAAVAPRRKAGFALSMGRICPEKGFHLALDAARRADVPFLLAGSVFPYPAHKSYFAREIAPRLDRRCRWVGPLSGAAKRHALAAARCLVVPSLVPETSSLVAREALAAGTPVVALRNGALPDVVDHGRTGFLVDTPADLAAAIRQAGTLDPEACRAAAMARFDARRMAEAYLALYRRLADTHRRAA